MRQGHGSWNEYRSGFCGFFEVCAALAIFASLALPPRNSRDRPPALRGLILAMSGGFVVPLAAPVATLVLRG